MTAEEYEYPQRCEATYAKRLARVLADLGVIGDRALIELAYPSEEQLVEAEEGEIL